jgi:hypothetical protein
MSTTPQETSSSGERRVIYIVIGVVVVIAMIIGVIVYRGNEETREAQDKADQLIAALEDAGAERLPSQEQIVGVLGNDGGALCVDPGSALAQTIRNGMLINGAAGPGQRPIQADNRAIRGELLIIEIYCPEELDEFQDSIDDLDLADDLVQD